MILQPQRKQLQGKHRHVRHPHETGSRSETMQRHSRSRSSMVAEYWSTRSTATTALAARYTRIGPCVCLSIKSRGMPHLPMQKRLSLGKSSCGAKTAPQCEHSATQVCRRNLLGCRFFLAFDVVFCACQPRLRFTRQQLQCRNLYLDQTMWQHAATGCRGGDFDTCSSLST